MICGMCLVRQHTEYNFIPARYYLAIRGRRGDGAGEPSCSGGTQKYSAALYIHTHRIFLVCTQTRTDIAPRLYQRGIAL